MSKSKKSQVKEAAWRIFETTGQLPSRQAIMDEIGGGSARDVQAELNEWKSELADWVHHQRHRPDMPDVLFQASSDLWAAAVQEARKAAEAALEKEREKLADRERQAQERVRLSAEELASVQKLNEELSADNRRIKADLDSLLEKHESCSQELNEVQRELALARQLAGERQKTLERMTAEIAALQDAREKEIRELNEAHERESDRWLRVIDDTRQEARESEKRVEQLSRQIDTLRDEVSREKQEHALALAKARGEAKHWKERHEAEVQRSKELKCEHREQIKNLRDELRHCQKSLERLQQDCAQKDVLIEKLKAKINEQTKQKRSKKNG